MSKTKVWIIGAKGRLGSTISAVSYTHLEQLYRALVVSNLVAIHQKKYIGSLSAYCGAVSAACGSGAAITYLLSLIHI